MQVGFLDVHIYTPLYRLPARRRGASELSLLHQPWQSSPLGVAEAVLGTVCFIVDFAWRGVLVP
jgi:hypothetical protein